MKSIFFKQRSLPVSLAMIAGALLAAGNAQAAGEKSQKGGLPAVEARVQALEDGAVDITAELNSLKDWLTALEEGGGGGGDGGPVDLEVICGVGTIGEALSLANPSRPVTITVVGECEEAVVISRDGVTLQGSGAPTDSVAGSVVVDGSSRVVIQDLEILASGDPLVTLEIDNGSSVKLFNLTVEGNVLVASNSSTDLVGDLFADDSKITGQVTVTAHSRLGLVGAAVDGSVGVTRDSLLELVFANISGSVTCPLLNTQSLVVRDFFSTAGGGIGPTCSLE